MKWNVIDEHMSLQFRLRDNRALRIRLVAVCLLAGEHVGNGSRTMFLKLRQKSIVVLFSIVYAALFMYFVRCQVRTIVCATCVS